jgi:hypothetical protein
MTEQPPADMTALPDLLHGRGRSGPVRQRRPVYVDLLPPCNAGCPAGENIQAWLAHAQAGRHEQAWRQLVADNPLAAIHGRRWRRTDRRGSHRTRGGTERRAAHGRDTDDRPGHALPGPEAAQPSGRFCFSAVEHRGRVRRLADSGAGAVVLYSLFEEQLRQAAARDAAVAEAGTDSFAESLSHFPQAASADGGLRHYLSLLERAAAVDVPVIASLNGSTTGGWTDYASALQDAGAAAIELNIYQLPGGPVATGRDVEQRHDVVMTASALLRHGPGYAHVLVDELSGWMARKGFRTVAELRGLLSVPARGDEAGYERAGYVTALKAANSHVGPW